MTSVTSIGRAIFWLSGIKSTVSGTGNIPDTQCIVVANHASYIDGVILNGYLPPRFSFVIKGEMGRVPVAGFVLRRIGSEFVERFDSSGSVRDARRLLKVAESGESLAFFPEGTFLAFPGLDRFRAGAFAAAINSKLPVVPVVISGSRQILPVPLTVDLIPESQKIARPTPLTQRLRLSLPGNTRAPSIAPRTQMMNTNQEYRPQTNAAIFLITAEMYAYPIQPVIQVTLC